MSAHLRLPEAHPLLASVIESAWHGEWRGDVKKSGSSSSVLVLTQPIRSVIAIGTVLMFWYDGQWVAVRCIKKVSAASTAPVLEAKASMHRMWRMKSEPIIG